MSSNSAGLPPIACALGTDELKARLVRNRRAKRSSPAGLAQC